MILFTVLVWCPLFTYALNLDRPLEEAELSRKLKTLLDILEEYKDSSENEINEDTVLQDLEVKQAVPVSIVPGYTAFQDQHIKGLNLEVYTGITEAECAQRCTNYWTSYNKYQCVSFDYDTANQKCFLSDRTLETIWTTTMLVSSNGIHHYQRDNVGICEVDVSQRKECNGAKNHRNEGKAMREQKCYEKGCCYRNKKCYLSKSSLPTDPLPCDANCSSVIEDILSGATNGNFDHTRFLEASLAEAKTFLPDIPLTFWTWLSTVKQGYMMEAILAIKWPVTPQLIRNLYELVTAFGKDLAASHSDLFVGVSYAMITTPVKNRMNLDYYRNMEMLLPKEAAATEGLSQSEVDQIKTAAEADAKSSLLITDQQIQQKFLTYNEGKDICAGNINKWVLLYKDGDSRQITPSTTCEKLQTLSVNSVEECKARSCYMRGNAFNMYHGKCYIYYCVHGDLTMKSRSADVYIYKDLQPVCTMTTQVDNGRQLSGQMKLLKSDMTVAECQQECLDRAACMSFTTDSRNGYCYLYRNLDELKSVNNRYVYKVKTCSANNPVTCTAASQGIANTCIPSAEDPNAAVTSERLLQIHSATENKVAGCYMEIQISQKPDVQTCQALGLAKKANLVLYKNGECILRRCYTDDLALNDTAAGEGYDIYQDQKLLFDQGTPLSWDVKRHNYVVGDQWSHLASIWKDKCMVLSVAELPFPPHLRMNGFDVIQHYLSRKYEFWNFPTMSAPWPLMSLLWPEASKRECDIVWSVVYSNVKPILYSRYTSEYRDKECLKSNWYPNGIATIPRILQDGGVCGRQSWLSEQSRQCLGQPALGMGEPGHRAMFYIDYNEAADNTDPLYGKYRAVKQQSIVKGTFYSNIIQHELSRQVPTGKEIVVRSSNFNMEYYMGLAASINIGVESFTKGQIAVAIHHRSPPTLKDKSLILLVNALKENPYLVNVWQYVTNYISGIEDPPRFKRYALTCPTDVNYYTHKDELWGLVKAHLRREISNNMKVGLPVTYTDILVRFYAPAPCCANPGVANEMIPIMQTEIVEVQKYTKDIATFGDCVRQFRLNMALCKAYEQGTWTEILDFVEPSIIDLSIITDKNWGQKKMADTMLFLDTIMEAKGGVNSANMQAIVDYFNINVMNSIAKITVTSFTWEISLEYKEITKKMIGLYKALGQIAEVDVINEELSDLVDRQHGTDMTWWQDMNQQGYLKGQQEDVLDGALVWDEANSQFIPGVKEENNPVTLDELEQI